MTKYTLIVFVFIFTTRVLNGAPFITTNKTTTNVIEIPNTKTYDASVCPDNCTFVFSQVSVITAQKDLEKFLHKQKSMLIYVTLYTKNLTLLPADQKKQNQIREWQWTLTENLWYVNLPIDLDYASFHITYYGESRIRLDLEAMDSTCCTIGDDAVNKVRDRLWFDVFSNKSGSLLCNRYFDNQDWKTSFFDITTVWIGYDFLCVAPDVDKNYSEKSDTTATLLIPLFCFFIALYYPLLNKIIENANIRNHLEHVKSEPGMKLTDYKKDDSPFGYRRIMLKYFFPTNLISSPDNQEHCMKKLKFVPVFRLTILYFLVYLFMTIVPMVLEYTFDEEELTDFDTIYKLGLPVFHFGEKTQIRFLTQMCLTCLVYLPLTVAAKAYATYCFSEHSDFLIFINSCDCFGKNVDDIIKEIKKADNNETSNIKTEQSADQHENDIPNEQTSKLTNQEANKQTFISEVLKFKFYSKFIMRFNLLLSKTFWQYIWEKSGSECLRWHFDRFLIFIINVLLIVPMCAFPTIWFMLFPVFNRIRGWVSGPTPFEKTDEPESGSTRERDTEGPNETKLGNTDEKVSRDMKETQLGNTDEKVSEDMKETESGDTKETVSEDMKETESKDTKETVSEDMKETESGDTKETVSEDMKETQLGNTDKTVSEDMKETESGDTKETVSEDMKETESKDTKETVSEDMKETESGDTKETVSEDMKETQLGNTDETVSEDMKETESGDTKETVSEDMKETESKDTEKTVSEDMKATESGDTEKTVPEETGKKDTQKALPTFLIQAVLIAWELFCIFLLYLDMSMIIFIERSVMYIVFIAITNYDHLLRIVIVVFTCAGYLGLFITAFVEKYAIVLKIMFEQKESTKTQDASKDSNEVPTAYPNETETVKSKDASAATKDSKNQCFISEKHFDYVIDHSYAVREHFFFVILKIVTTVMFFMVSLAILLQSNVFDSTTKLTNIIEFMVIIVTPTLVLKCFEKNKGSPMNDHEQDIKDNTNSFKNNDSDFNNDINCCSKCFGLWCCWARCQFKNKTRDSVGSISVQLNTDGQQTQQEPVVDNPILNSNETHEDAPLCNDRTHQYYQSTSMEVNSSSDDREKLINIDNE